MRGVKRKKDASKKKEETEKKQRKIGWKNKHKKRIC